VPYTLTDDLIQATSNYLNNQGSLSELIMLRKVWFGEIAAQERERLARGAAPNGQAQQPVAAPLDPTADGAAADGGQNLSRQQRRKLGREIARGTVKVNGAAAGQPAQPQSQAQPRNNPAP
jgi:hypothetical protein